MPQARNEPGNQLGEGDPSNRHGSDPRTPQNGRRDFDVTAHCGPIGPNPAVRTYAVADAGVGTTLTYHLYLPSTAPTGIQAKAYVSDSGWNQTFGPAVDLLPGWNVVSWTVPATVPVPPKALGIQILNHPGRLGSVYMDDVAWWAAGYPYINPCLAVLHKQGDAGRVGVRRG